MKKYLITMLALTAMLSLMSTAYADVIASPGEVAMIYAAWFLPWILVGAVVIVTVVLLRKFWKKRK